MKGQHEFRPLFLAALAVALCIGLLSFIYIDWRPCRMVQRLEYDSLGDHEKILLAVLKEDQACARLENGKVANAATYSSFSPDGFAQEFPQSELEFLAKQAEGYRMEFRKNRSPLHWDSGLFFPESLVPWDSLVLPGFATDNWRINNHAFLKRNLNTPIIHFSCPLISSDGNLAYIEMVGMIWAESKFAQAEFGGSVSSFLLRKEGQKWKVVERKMLRIT